MVHKIILLMLYNAMMSHIKTELWSRAVAEKKCMLKDQMCLLTFARRVSYRWNSKKLNFNNMRKLMMAKQAMPSLIRVSLSSFVEP